MNISICEQCESEIIEFIPTELNLIQCSCQELVHIIDGSFATEQEKLYMHALKKSRHTPYFIERS